MIWKISMVLAGVVISMGLGALMALWRCSQRSWCPRYLRRQLDAWRKRMERQNEERHSRLPIPKRDDRGGSAAGED